MGKKTGRRYSPEFKQEALRLLQASDEKNPVQKIARDLLGICTETLPKWANPRPRSMQETGKDSPQERRKNCAVSCAKR
jgi:transposase-like protein